MLGKTAKKYTRWIGKAISTVEKGNNWIGKALNTVEKTYGKGKKALINEASKIGMEEPLKSAILHLEASPIGAGVESVFKTAKSFNQDVKTILNNPVTKLTRAGLDYVIESNSKPFIQLSSSSSGNKLKQFQTS